MLVCRSQDGASLPLVDDDLARLQDGLAATHTVQRATPTDISVNPAK